MESQYVQHSYTGKVFKVTPTHLLQISPWKIGDDRRIYEEINDNYRVITYKNAVRIETPLNFIINFFN